LLSSAPCRRRPLSSNVRPHNSTNTAQGGPMNFRTPTLLPVIASLLLAGCATSTTNYTPPAEPKIVNTKFVNKPFEAVWDSLVKELSGDFFVINNIDKNSRLINISFTSQRPSEFVDCGVTSRTFTNARGDQNYTYKTADSSNFVSTNNQGHAFSVRRNSRLEGRTNIYVAPEGSGTNITVNTKYVVGPANFNLGNSMA